MPKAWGREFWVVNTSRYCGKLLCIDAGATSSYHYHPKKEETFYCLEGEVVVTVEGEECLLSPGRKPLLIYSGQPHKFRGICDSVLVEFSTHHEDSDVVRLTESVSSQSE